MTTSTTPADRLTDQMHAVLDGTASPEQRDSLDAVLAASPAAAEEFASWQAMFRTLSAMPMAHPPEGLVASISAALPAAPTQGAKTFSERDQLFVSPSVIASGQTKTIRSPSGFRAFFRRPNRSVSTQEFGQMNATRKIWAGGAVAAVALGVAFFATQYPPKPENVIGTVAPAERYRAPQAGAEAVKLGDQTGTSTAQTSTDATSPEASKANAQLMADKVSADRLAMDRASADKLSADRLAADRQSAKMMADKSSAEMMAEKSTAKRMADKTEAEMMAEKTSSKMMAEKSNAKMMADRQATAEKSSIAERGATVDRAAVADRSTIAADRLIAERALADRTRAERAANAERADAASRAQKLDASSRSADKAATN